MKNLKDELKVRIITPLRHWLTLSSLSGCIAYFLSFAISFTVIGWLASTVHSAVKENAQLAAQIKKDFALTRLKDILSAQAPAQIEESSLVLSAPLQTDDVFNLIDQSITPALPAPMISEEERLQLLEARDILRDPLSRISSEFQVPSKLQERTLFWFRIYTEFDQYDHVIHHLRYPWIIFKVINTKEMIESGKGPLWMRRQKAENFVNQEKKRIISLLYRLSKNPHQQNLTDEQLDILRPIKNLNRADLKKELLFASHSVRSQLGQKDFFMSGLRRSGKYLPYMEEEFQSLGLPTELTRLPFVESSFNEKAKSKVGASGIWQIMPMTGRSYLKVNNTIDERNSPLKATRAAGLLLRNYYKSLDRKWPLAITSYNHGIGNIRKSMKIARSNDLSTIIERYHGGSFKFASSNFYSCFLAALFAEKYHDAIFPAVSKHRLLERQTLTLTSNVAISRLNQVTGLSFESLKLYNKDIEESLNKRSGFLPKGYVLHLPLKTQNQEGYRSADRGSMTRFAKPGSENTTSL